jgi:DNA primase catalytic subunit
MMRQYGHGLEVGDLVRGTAEAWYFTHWFVDLETNVATPRQWREGKRSVVDGKMDEERKMQIRYNRGQSKNIRNAILDAMPEWLVNKAIEEAKGGVRTKIEAFIKENSLAAAQEYIVKALARHGITEAQILAKTMRDKVEGLDIDNLVELKDDLRSIESGSESAASLFPAGRAEAPKMDLKDKLKAQVESTPKAEPKAESKAGKHMAVRLGTEAFTFLVNDGMQEYTVKDDTVALKCNCGVTKGPCPHTKAVEAFQNRS